MKFSILLSKWLATVVDNIERIAKLTIETISVKDKLIENLTKERYTVSGLDLE